MTGDDDIPSPLLDALSAIPGVQASALELGQDVAILAADIVDTIADDLEAPAMMGMELFAVVSAAVPEIVADVKGLPRA